MRVPFGRYKGKRYTEVPAWHLRWLIARRPSLDAVALAAEQELARRIRLASELSDDELQRVVDDWEREHGDSRHRRRTNTHDGIQFPPEV